MTGKQAENVLMNMGSEKLVSGVTTIRSFPAMVEKIITLNRIRVTTVFISLVLPQNKPCYNKCISVRYI